MKRGGPKHPRSDSARTRQEVAEDRQTRKTHGQRRFAPYPGRRGENHGFHAGRGESRAFKRCAAAKRVANEMRAGFALRRQESQSETRKIGNRLAVLLRLIGQAMAEHVEGVDTVPGGERRDIVLTFQNRAADSGEENDSRARPSACQKRVRNVQTSTYRSSNGSEAGSRDSTMIVSIGSPFSSKTRQAASM
jgi:hypothetical protein